MSKEELKVWFIEKFNSCYAVKHDDYPDNILWFYDESFVRKVKLSRINGSEVKLPSSVSGICLFDQSCKNAYLWCDYTHIWSIFENSLSINYNEIQSFISEILKDASKFYAYSIFSVEIQQTNRLKDVSKLKVCVPGVAKVTTQYMLEDSSKLKVYIPVSVLSEKNPRLSNISKLNVYIPKCDGIVDSIKLEDIKKYNH